MPRSYPRPSGRVSIIIPFRDRPELLANCLRSLGTGTYQVDFGQDISGCAFAMTQGEGGIGGAGGAVVGITDRSGNSNAVFATTRQNSDNTLINTAFQVIVACPPAP